MKEPRIAQLLRRESPNPINFTITHGRGRKGIIIEPVSRAFYRRSCGQLVKREGYGYDGNDT